MVRVKVRWEDRKYHILVDENGHKVLDIIENAKGLYRVIEGFFSMRYSGLLEFCRYGDVSYVKLFDRVLFSEIDVLNIVDCNETIRLPAPILADRVLRFINTHYEIIENCIKGTVKEAEVISDS